MATRSDPLWYRSRGLQKMEERFGADRIQKFISRLSKKNVRVLEIGFGEGACLLDLRKKFPDIELYGINHKTSNTMSKRADFEDRAAALSLRCPKTKLPIPYFYDAGDGLRFPQQTFDVVISQVAFHYVAKKAELLEEIWRVLKVGGRAYLHIDTRYTDEYPDFMKQNAETPRWIIYRREKMIKTSTYLKLFGLQLRRRKNQRILVFERTSKKELKLRLLFDGNSSLDLTKLKYFDPHKVDPAVWWGTRSVYNTKV